MNKNDITFSGSPISISEHGTYKLATFMISVLDEYDRGGRMIPKESGELYHDTIRGFPIVAKLITDAKGKPIDFRGHEMTIVREANGEKRAKFGTVPIGSVIDSWIEDRYVAEYNAEKSCIMIQAKLWSKRFPEYFKVFDKLWEENKISSSWELETTEVEHTSFGKILKVFSFIGNALLGTGVTPAVPGAGVYEYAELPPEVELAQALSNDMCTDNKEDYMENTNPSGVAEVVDDPQVVTEEVVSEEPEVTAEHPVDETQQTAEETPDEPAPAEEDDTIDSASLTENDLRNHLNRKCKEAIPGCDYGWVAHHFPAEQTVWYEAHPRKSELDYVLFTYAVEGDEVTISEPQLVTLSVSVAEINSAIAERDATIVQANHSIQELNDSVAELSQYKEKWEQAEAAKHEAEIAEQRENLKQYALKSRLIAETEIENDDEIKACIAEVNKAGIDAIISHRYMANIEQQAETVASVETQTHAHRDLNDEEDTTPKGKLFVRAYINK